VLLLFEVLEVEFSSLGLHVVLSELRVGQMPQLSSEDGFLEVATELAARCAFGVHNDAAFEVDVVLRVRGPVCLYVRSHWVISDYTTIMTDNSHQRGTHRLPTHINGVLGRTQSGFEE
jgi:hypothetical protein